MNAERWQRIAENFDAVLQYPSCERDSFLAQACGDDEALKSEVARLIVEFERAGDFLESPLHTRGLAMAAGDFIAGRYRIETLLGRGGMGEVYRAHDELMGELVALKTLRAELNRNQSVLRRFQREIQLARKVTHPNVCRVFDVGVQEHGHRQQFFFTMQLLEGETLAARIRRTGPLSKQEAFPLIVQMAQGLCAAHEAGITHRDFKSSNVMLCAGKAMITDFGLARLGVGEVQTDGTFTSNAQIAGTIAYMSPEQLAGGTVTAASDIYSFGVVLFEMATGRLPFDDRHIIHSAMQRVSEVAPDVRSLAPNIDPHWATAIARCLQRDASNRFRNAGEVVRFFRPEAWTLPVAHWPRRKWVAAATVAAGAAALSSIFPVLRSYKQDGKIHEGAEALVTPIINSTGEATFDAITELFRSQLSQSVHLNLVDSGRLVGSLKRMGKPEDTSDPAAIREAAWRLNAALSVFGNVSRIGSDYALNIQIETRGSQPNNPATKSLRSFSATDPTALMRVVRDASVWVRESVGESASNIASFDRLPAEVTTPSWEALSYYARGQRYFMQQQYEPALLEFEAALRVDRKFTLAALRRADLLVSRGRQTEGFPQYRSAVAMLSERSVTRVEELNARGIFAFDSGDVEGSDKYFRTWAVEYPRDWRAPYYRIIGLILNGHASEALDLLANLRRQLPDFGDLYAQTIAAHLVLGQTEQARSFVPQLRKLNGPDRGNTREGFIRFREGDLIGYLDILRAKQRSSSQVAATDGMLHEAMLCIDAGIPDRVPGRISAFLSGHSWAETLPDQASLWVIQAWCEMLIGEHKAAVSNARRALELESGPLIVALAGTVFARAGVRGLAMQARDISSKLPDIPLYEIAFHRIAGETATVSGNAEQAIQEFRKAAALEPLIGHRQYLIEALPPGAERLNLSLNVVRIPWQALRPPPMHSVGSLSLAVPIVNSAGADEPFAKKFAAAAKELQSAVQ